MIRNRFKPEDKKEVEEENKTPSLYNECSCDFAEFARKKLASIPNTGAGPRKLTLEEQKKVDQV